MANTGEPTYTDDDGKERPGSQALNSTVTTQMVSNADAAWQEHHKDSKLRNRFSAQNPQIAEPYSPLETLVNDAFERFGNMSVETLDGSVKRILFRYANRIIEDVRIHPYWDLPDLDYYISLQDCRPVPDEIMITGLAFHYAKWMNSTRAATLGAEYAQALNQILYQRKYGSGKLQMAAVDRPHIVSKTVSPEKKDHE